MKTDLHSRSALMAQRAVRHFLDEEVDRFFIHAAVAFELLAKARLAQIHPALIAADKDFDALLHLCGGGKHTKTPPWKIKTLGAREVLTRCLKVEPTLSELERDLNLLAEVRNSIVHLGMVPTTDVRRIFLSFVRATALLVKELGLTMTGYFGEFEDVVTTHLDRTAADATLSVATRIARCTASYKERYGSLSTEQLEMILQAIYASIRIERYVEALIACPACKRNGVARGPYDVDWDVAVGREGNVEGVSPRVTLLPQEFRCPVCHLQLKGALELEAAKLSTRLAISDVDPTDFVDPREPGDAFDFEPAGYEPQDYDPGDYDSLGYEPEDPGEYEPQDYEPQEDEPQEGEPPDQDPPEPPEYEPAEPDQDYEPPDEPDRDE